MIKVLLTAATSSSSAAFSTSFSSSSTLFRQSLRSSSCHDIIDQVNSAAEISSHITFDKIPYENSLLAHSLQHSRIKSKDMIRQVLTFKIFKPMVRNFPQHSEIGYSFSLSLFKKTLSEDVDRHQAKCTCFTAGFSIKNHKIK